MIFSSLPSAQIWLKTEKIKVVRVYHVQVLSASFDQVRWKEGYKTCDNNFPANQKLLAKLLRE